MPLSSLPAPHGSIRTRDPRESFLAELLDALWEDYRGRMEYVLSYEEILRAHRARFFNDHVAFRSLAGGPANAGISSVSRPFEALGYVPVACYEFPDKHLSSIHFKHPRPEFPKVFISQLKTWELSAESRRILGKSLAGHRAPLGDDLLADLQGLAGVSKKRRADLLKNLLRHFRQLPWEVPQKKDVIALDRESQFGAWVLVNGYGVNHFTASVDSHGVKALDDIEKVQAAFLKAGVPMKKEIEGKRGDRLRQTATEAVVLPAKVRDGRRTVEIPWTYAYFEVAQRPLLKDPATGRRRRFEGFLGAQATNLFDMTRLNGHDRRNH
jgi:hypothetical protein